MHCNHCGREIPQESRYCCYCGQTLSKNQSEPNNRKNAFVSSFSTFFKQNKKRVVAAAAAVIAAGGIGTYGVNRFVSSNVTSSESFQVSETKIQKTVYVTPSGTKYHRASCRYVKKNGIAKNLDDVKGSYEPCSVCKP